MKTNTQVLEVWGEFACFTRPELKVERFSYPVITPSAARGIFDAIYCKPKEFRWQITKIEILAEPNYIALRRNEVKEKISVDLVNKFRKGTKNIEPIWAEENRVQRQSMALKDVKYRLYAYIHPWRGFEDRTTALEAQFRRRASHGKCIYQPYFGCREFPAFFKLVDAVKPPVFDSPVNIDNLGWMLYDVFDLSRPGSKTDNQAVSLFKPIVRGNVLVVPPYDSEDVFKVNERST